MIALIITIIVLLILAGVTISLVAGDNGALSRASSAASKTKLAEVEEDIKLAWSAKTADYLADLAEGKAVSKKNYYTKGMLDDELNKGTIVENFDYNEAGTTSFQYQREDTKEIYDVTVDSRGNVKSTAFEKVEGKSSKSGGPWEIDETTGTILSYNEEPPSHVIVPNYVDGVKIVCFGSGQEVFSVGSSSVTQLTLSNRNK